MPLAGSVIAIFLILFFVGFTVFSATSRKSGTATTGERYSPSTDHILYGATLIDDGYAYYPDWCAMMLREFDESIESKMQQYYGIAKSIAEQPHDQWGSLAQSFDTD